MTVLRCRRFPRGTVHIRTAAGDVVDFHDGRADLDDPDLVEALLAVPPVFGIELESPTDPAAPPPKAGRGSGLDAWTAYAHSYGVAVPEGMKRDELVEVLEQRGIPTE